jgi:hypothetical protein
MAGGEHGGRGKGDPVFASFLDMLGLKSPRVAYVGAANDDDSYYYSVIETALLESGAGEVFLASFKGNASARRRPEGADIVFISGGDVECGMMNLAADKAIGPLIDLYKRGMPFVGVSAGSIMMGSSWVHWSDPDDDSTASLFPCLGFADFLCDAHDEFDDWGELKSALSVSEDGSVGYGIPTGGGFVIAPGSAPKPCGKEIAVFRRLSGRTLRVDSIR